MTVKVSSLPNTGTGVVAATSIGGSQIIDLGLIWYFLIAFAVVVMALNVTSQIRLYRAQRATGQ